MRRILSLLIVGLPILAAAGCGVVREAMYKSAIEKAIHEDALTGKEPTSGHTDAMRKVDLSDCPRDFRIAYMNHIHAWDEAVAVYGAKMKLDRDEDAAAVGGIVASIFGSDASPWSDHVRAQQEVQKLTAVASRDISSTWQQVESVASKYGAQVAQ